MIRQFGEHVKVLQTDGGLEFKSEFLYDIHQFYELHRIAKPYRKNEQAYIESFNRTLRKEGLGWVKYQLAELEKCQEIADTFLLGYHYNRPHMGHGMAPPLPLKEGDCRILTETYRGIDKID